MSFTNFRTSISCCVCCLFACSMSVNAQEFDLNLSGSSNPNFIFGTTGDLLIPFDDDRDLFTATPNPDGLTTSNVLTAPITVDVAEEDGTLELSILNATATSGIDGNPDNRVNLNITGLGISIAGPSTRIDPAFSANTLGNSTASSPFFLDGALDQFLTLSFNQDVIISAIGITFLGDGETFTFGSATNITNQIDNPSGVFEEDVLGINNTLNVDRFTFATPLEIAAGEEILVGQSGVNPGSSGVGFEIIRLQVAPSFLLGDVNMDGLVNFLDITPFIGLLSSGDFKDEADIDRDGMVSFLDISPFIGLLSGQ